MYHSNLEIKWPVSVAKRLMLYFLHILARILVETCFSNEPLLTVCYAASCCKLGFFIIIEF